MTPTDDVVLVGWVDHEGYVWKDDNDASSFFGSTPYSLSPCFSVKTMTKEFNGY